jgi:hypothetical protein
MDRNKQKDIWKLKKKIKLIKRKFIKKFKEKEVIL